MRWAFRRALCKRVRLVLHRNVASRLAACVRVFWPMKLLAGIGSPEASHLLCNSLPLPDQINSWQRQRADSAQTIETGSRKRVLVAIANKNCEEARLQI